MSATMNKAWLGLLSAPLVFGACGGNDPVKNELFTPKPECQGASIVPYMGDTRMVISDLAIGSLSDGFDLDGDGKPDNKLAAVANLAQSSITDSFKNYSIVIPFEFFDMPAVAADACIKFAIYLATVDKDTDGDGKRPGVDGGDCNEGDATIHPGATEIVGNFKDDNCDGKADESAAGPSTDTMDRDGDGKSMAQGDCDDTNKLVAPGLPEICNDGLDNDCDGVADRSVDASGKVTACSPYAPTAELPLDALSFITGMPTMPQIVFTSGSVGADLKLTAGPSLFSVKIPVTGDLKLDLRITGATIKGDLTMTADGPALMNAHLGGVIDARTADTIRGLSVSQIGLTPEDSLLDAIFANILGPLLALPQKPKTFKYPGCRTPDIDVDGDGLEIFCDTHVNDDVDPKTVNLCIDGDGTEVFDEVDANGVVTKQCTEAVDAAGKPRFVDGISVELNFTALPVKKLLPPQ
jgi:hypothetical protein